MRKISGQKISRLWTIGSWFDGGFICGEAKIDGKMQNFRIHVNEIRKMVNDFIFEVDEPGSDRRRIHILLRNPESVYDDDCAIREDCREYF